MCFTKLTDSTGYYFFMPQDIYILDYIHRKTRFLNKRECCGSYDEIIGATPAYKLSSFSTESNDFINRSEYYFGTKGCKDPLIIIGLETEQKMKAFGIKGVSYINVYSIETIYGKSKPIDEVTLQDMQENPIWIFALDEEDSDEVDESWLKPILKSDNVMSEFVEAYILLKSTDGQYYISANLDIKKEVLDDVTFWKPEQQCWIPIENIDSYKEMQFIAVPKIEKETDILFGFDSSKNLFSSLRSQAQLKEKKKTIFSFSLHHYLNENNSGTQHARNRSHIIVKEYKYLIYTLLNEYNDLLSKIKVSSSTDTTKLSLDEDTAYEIRELASDEVALHFDENYEPMEEGWI